ncbi:TRAF3-interacting protein 1 [Polypterus senegalus]|uniref:TRAF3-interacting protein 1 n=1 Tax=Polypterus senegalus TaxID=55291 RepID=UPI0019653D8C|nr:TRAF3-interacting protein 1 [Polypterus senegalus]XP_039612366.1 TRAF3-interacting protein 1 [Polypterus senegalus]
MNSSVTKKTQDSLGKVIKKPPLTEKLLSKPPFRYLHDIFTEVIRTTGFMKGLYLESELKSENVKDKDAKIIFLQKAIDVVIMVTGEALSVKPARIVAGHEPEKTNELLQAIGKCCLNKLSSDDAVKRVLAGDKPDLKGKPPSTSKIQDKENRESKEEEKRKHKDREEKKDEEIKERSTSRDRKEEQKETESKKTEKDRHRDGEKYDKGRDRERTRDRDRDKEKSRDRDKEKRDKGKDQEQSNEKDREKRRERNKPRELPNDLDVKSKELTDTESSKPPEPSARSIKTDTQNETESPARIPRPSSAKGQRRRHKPGGADESDSDGDTETVAPSVLLPSENGDISEPNSHLSQRRLPRPSSARLAPPRVKRQESADVPPVERVNSGKTRSAVIVDGIKNSDDEEDDDQEFMVEEAAQPPPDMPEMELEPAIELKDGEKHGGLVKKILETKKEYESSQNSAKSKEREKTILSETARKSERDLVTREIEKLRSSIQTVCRSTLPLGKIMDYIQEDMDSMQNELQMWRRENKEHAESLLREQSITDSAVEPLKAELEELEQLIRDQQDKICAVKANILKNEEKIQKMVLSINISSKT